MGAVMAWVFLKASVWVYECIACDVGISSKTGFVEDANATFLKPLVYSDVKIYCVKEDVFLKPRCETPLMAIDHLVKWSFNIQLCHISSDKSFNFLAPVYFS